MRSLIATSIVFVAALSQLGASDCGGNAIRDSGFDLWCGDVMCAWKVERGDARKVPTWNEGDFGVDLVGSDAAIEQLSPYNSTDGTCLEFQLVANVEETAEVYLNVDVEGDGTIEMMERFPTSNWKPLSYVISIVRPYDGIRFELTKRGPGKAVMANIKAHGVDSARCAGLSVLDPGPRRNGATCVAVNDCMSAICAPSPTPTPDPPPGGSLTCVGCNATSCGSSSTCGLGDAFSPLFAVPLECVAVASKELGESCFNNAECASSICYKPSGALIGTCSSCASNSQCTGGLVCSPAAGTGWRAAPHVCGGGAMAAGSGAPCGQSSDCASNTCNGAERMECEKDGRPCTSPADCPFEQLQNTACSTVGIQGGTCQ